MTEYWNTYKSFIYQNCTDSEVERTSVQFWKNQLFAASAVYLIPLSLVALIPSVYLSLKNDVMGILVADFIAIGTIMGVAFIPGISVYVRKLILNACFYFISVVMLLYLGSNGPGMLYLLAVSVFVVLSMDRLYGYVVFALNILICITFAVVIHYEFVNTILLTQYQLDTWIGVSSNLIFLSGTAIFLIPHLYKGLQSSFDEQSVLKGKLERSIDELKFSENKFKALVQDGFDLIAVLDEKANYKYVSPTAETVLGIEADKFIGTNAIEQIHPDDQERISEILANLASEERVEVAPFRFQNSEGSWQWIESTVTNLLENPAVKGFVANSQDVTEQIDYQKQLEESLTEKETLLAEIHHRVKNNLAIITSMMELQAMESGNSELQDSLRIAQQRIKTIANIHELLYGSESLSYIDFGDNITHLVRNIENMYNGTSKRITVTVDVDYVPININQAIPCALLVNEVVTNAYKHAFKNQEEGNIDVRLQEDKENIQIDIRDNGIGLQDDFMADTSSSIGMTLINLLKQQLEGEMKFLNQNGTHFVFTFKKADVKGSASSITVN